MRRRAAFAVAAAVLATACSAMPAPAVAGSADSAARRLAGLAASLEEPDWQAMDGLPISSRSSTRQLTDLEKLQALAGHHARRFLLGLPIIGPAPTEVSLTLDPEVARFQAYVGTLAPGVYATYIFIGIGYMFVLCCCMFGCCLCCTMALLPTELCVCSFC